MENILAAMVLGMGFIACDAAYTMTRNYRIIIVGALCTVLWLAIVILAF